MRHNITAAASRVSRILRVSHVPQVSRVSWLSRLSRPSGAARVFFLCCLSALLCLPGCRLAASHDAPAPPRAVLSLPVTSDAVAEYYHQGKQGFEFFVRPVYEQYAVHFTGQEASVPLQSDMFNFVRTDWKYYEIGRFRMGGEEYALIIYNYPGEFDDPYLNVQLNAYNARGELTDALVLDCRYHFEDVEGFSRYTIEGDTVSIQSYVGYYWEADNLDAGTVNKPVWQIFRKKQYRIGDGKFTLLTEEKFPVTFINKERPD